MHLGDESLPSRRLEVTTFAEVVDNLAQLRLIGILEHAQINIAYARAHSAQLRLRQSIHQQFVAKLLG